MGPGIYEIKKKERKLKMNSMENAFFWEGRCILKRRKMHSLLCGNGRELTFCLCNCAKTGINTTSI
jgi:hypothetical protein